MGAVVELTGESDPVYAPRAVHLRELEDELLWALTYEWPEGVEAQGLAANSGQSFIRTMSALRALEAAGKVGNESDFPHSPIPRVWKSKVSKQDLREPVRQRASDPESPRVVWEGEPPGVDRARGVVVWRTVQRSSLFMALYTSVEVRGVDAMGHEFWGPATDEQTLHVLRHAVPELARGSADQKAT